MKKLILVFIGFLLLYSCDKDCSEKSSYSGIIIEDVSNTCLLDISITDGIVIETDSQFLDLLGQIPNFSCDTPQINFSENTLLGLYADGACDVAFQRNVKIDALNQQYVYTVKVKECGSCLSLGYSTNLVLVPKLPQNWTVEFIVK
jgi:hypothetical protein